MASQAKVERREMRLQDALEILGQAVRRAEERRKVYAEELKWFLHRVEVLARELDCMDSVDAALPGGAKLESRPAEVDEDCVNIMIEAGSSEGEAEQRCTEYRIVLQGEPDYDTIVNYNDALEDALRALRLLESYRELQKWIDDDQQVQQAIETLEEYLRRVREWLCPQERG